MTEFALDNLLDMIALLNANAKRIGEMSFSREVRIDSAGLMYCARCGRNMSTDVRVLYAPVLGVGNVLPLLFAPQPRGYANASDASSDAGSAKGPGVTSTSIAPSLYEYTCRNCGLASIALVYKGPDAPALAVFPSAHGGLATRHTPSLVSYYLDQAYKCQSASAMTAAVAMYRTALENLLFDRGYRDGMLQQKLNDLQKQIDQGKPPAWAEGLDTRFLTVLKKLGNISVHPNNGDISIQAELDVQLLTAVKATFAELLYRVYEKPAEDAARLAQLEAVTRHEAKGG